MPRAATLVAAALATLGLTSCAFVKVAPPSGVTLDEATLNGSLGSAFDWEGEWWFEYGTTGAAEERTPRTAASVSAGERVPVDATITGLERATAYFYRLCIEDSARRAPPACSDLNTVHTGDVVRVDNAVFRNDPVDGFLANVLVDATSGPAGEEPGGRVDFDYSFPDDRPDLGGPVTCLRVDGQRAAIGVDDEGGNDFVLYVAVTGTTATGQQKHMGLFPAAEDPASCPDPATLAPAPWTIAGGIPVIVDGP